MSQFGNLYSAYYDLIYQDKDYTLEVNYVSDLMTQHSQSIKSILDLGCGTGKHAEILSDNGFNVHGVDLSEHMLEIAEKRRIGKENRLCFTHSDIQTLKLDKKFDVVVSLFHVMCYQSNNELLENAFKIVKEHLNDGGLFIFDFWYGPAVLTDLPTVRTKRLENDDIELTRVVEPSLDAQANVVDVYYDMFIKSKQTEEIAQKKEHHKIRYFFDTELEMLCSKLGFKIEKKYKWLTNDNPSFDSWYVVWVLRK